jgi:hypothetical protein
MSERRKTSVVFADDALKEAYSALAGENPELYRFITRALNDLKENPTCGIHIPKKLIPKVYIRKFAIDNLWKYNLLRGWRLVYSLVGSKIEIVAIVLEWFSHKEYERRFKY